MNTVKLAIHELNIGFLTRLGLDECIKAKPTQVYYRYTWQKVFR